MLKFGIGITSRDFSNIIREVLRRSIMWVQNCEHRFEASCTISAGLYPPIGNSYHTLCGNLAIPNGWYKRNRLSPEHSDGAQSLAASSFCAASAASAAIQVLSGAKVRRWMTQPPCCRRAAMWAAVPYPLCWQKPYSGHMRCASSIRRSLVTCKYK